MPKKILVIEDNNDVRENVQEILMLNQYEVETAENGARGIDKIYSMNPDIIVCDIAMPVMDGFEVLDKISVHPEYSKIPFIFLTARTDRESFRRGMELGADDFITKPFHEEELIRAIETRLKKQALAESSFVRSPQGFQEFLDDMRSLDLIKGEADKHQQFTFDRKDVIYQEGDEPRYVYFIESGKVKTTRVSDDGKELISAVYSDGDFFGYLALFENVEYSETATAIESTKLAAINKTDFFDIIGGNPQVAAKFIRILANQVSDTEEKLLHIAYDSVRKRTAEALVDMYKAFSQGQSTGEISISRQELAQYVGTATETVIRTLASLKNDKLIDIVNGDIRILDLAGLLRLKN